mgnify:FL=1
MLAKQSQLCGTGSPPALITSQVSHCDILRNVLAPMGQWNQMIERDDAKGDVTPANMTLAAISPVNTRKIKSGDSPAFFSLASSGLDTHAYQTRPFRMFPSPFSDFFYVLFAVYSIITTLCFTKFCAMGRTIARRSLSISFSIDLLPSLARRFVLCLADWTSGQRFSHFSPNVHRIGVISLISASFQPIRIPSVVTPQIFPHTGPTTVGSTIMARAILWEELHQKVGATLWTIFMGSSHGSR